jgi:hypothetical protein
MFCQSMFCQSIKLAYRSLPPGWLRAELGLQPQTHGPDAAWIHGESLLFQRRQGPRWSR